MPRYEFTTGQVLTAGELNDLSDQTVMVFAGTAARGSAIPSPSEGMVTYRSDDDVVEVFDGSAFVGVGAASAILQVVSVFKDDAFTLTSTTYTDITGLSATITPSSTSSKVLVVVNYNVAVNPSLAQAHSRLMRGGSQIASPASVGSRTPAYNDGANLTGTSQNIFFLDSPATVSATTYNVQIRGNTANPLAVNRRVDDTDEAQRSRTVSTITLMEVAG